MTDFLKTYSNTELASLVTKRLPLDRDVDERKDDSRNENPVAIHCIEDFTNLKKSVQPYTILGIPEDIGVRANLGRAGAAEGFDEFLKVWAGMPENSWSLSNHFSLTGAVAVADLMHKSAALDATLHQDRRTLSELVVEVDFRASEIITKIFNCGKIPVIIGGGHNNALPIMQAYHASTNKPISVINIDAHTDLRPPLGRHSGNGFSHALKTGILDHYAVMGVQPLYLTREMVDMMEEYDVSYLPLEGVWGGGDDAFAKAFLSSLKKDADYGLELDLDVVRDFPSSAKSPIGLDLSEVMALVTLLSSIRKPAYIHICEGAPRHGYQNQVGKAICGILSVVV